MTERSTVVPVAVLISAEDLATLQEQLALIPARATPTQRLLNGWTDEMMQWFVLLGAIAESVRNGDIWFGGKDG